MSNIKLCESNGNATEQLWVTVTEKNATNKNIHRHIQTLKEHLMDNYSEGTVIANINQGPMFDKAVEMISKDVALIALNQQLNALQKQQKLIKEQFLLSVNEELGPEENGQHYSFNPLSCDIVRIEQNQNNNSETAESHKTTLNHYLQLIQQILDSPVVAGHIINNTHLPNWLREMAVDIQKGGLKINNLRKQLEYLITR